MIILGACIRTYFYTANDFQGTLGEVDYKPNGEVDRKFVFQQMRGGKFVDAN